MIFILIFIDNKNLLNQNMTSLVESVWHQYLSLKLLPYELYFYL